MAYTYDDFVSAATGAGMLDKFGQNDLQVARSNPEYGLSVLKLNQDLQKATTPEQVMLAQEALKQLRQSYGVTDTQPVSAVAGSGQTVYQQALNSAAPQAAAPEAVPAGSEVTGGTAYQQALNNGGVVPSGFQYNPETDPSYEALKKSYLREGERAREDMLATVAAATGGVPSSWAVTAASQAGDYYNTQLADMIPTLEQNAYQRYLNDYALKKEAAELMAGKGDYSRLAELYGLTEEEVAKLRRTGGSAYNPSQNPNTQTEPEAELSDAAQSFMNNLPYLPGGGDNESWKRNVLEALRNSGLSDEEKEEIAYRLGL